MTESEFSAGAETPAGSADADLVAAGAPADVGPGSAGAPAGVGPGSAGAPADVDDDVEVVDGLPVVAEVRAVERPAPASLPAVQVAAVAATGFVAGAATVALVRRRTTRKPSRSGSRRAADMLPIAATRSFLVDVHVIAKPGE